LLTRLDLANGLSPDSLTGCGWKGRMSPPISGCASTSSARTTAENAGIAGQRSVSQFRQHAIEAGRQVVSNFADLFVYDMEIVESAACVIG
jgi:hypothetical protein